MALSENPCGHIFYCVRLIRAADHGIDWRTRYPAGRPIPGRRSRYVRAGKLLDSAHTLLDRAQRCVPARGVHSRSRDFPSADGGLPGTCRLASFVHFVPFALHHWTGLHVVSMGHVTAGSGVSRDLLRIVQADDPLVPVAAIPAGIPIRCGQTAESRPDVAEPGRAELSLLDAAVTNTDRLVHAATAARLPAILDGCGAVPRIACSIPHFYAPALAVFRRSVHSVSSDAHLSHRQLHLLQLADHSAMPVPFRRRCAGQAPPASAECSNQTGVSSRDSSGNRDAQWTGAVGHVLWAR